ncbi:MAG: hypothetical protein P8176_14630 [Gammaproteobacteria bacterium]
MLIIKYFMTAMSWLLSIALLVSVVGCKSDGVVNSTGASSSDSSTSDSESTATTQTVSIGGFVGSDFQAEKVIVGIGSSSLSPGGTTTAQVSLVDQNNTLVTDSISVTFSSPCIAAGTAIVTSPITTTTGTATTTYLAKGCVGDDVLTATATVSDTVLRATETITVVADTVQSIATESVENQSINIVGTGGDETSKITFKVLGSTGDPRSGVNVDFSLSTSVGDLALSETSGVTDADGLVSTTVQAGTVATSVRVTATVTDTSLSTQSGQLIVSTGLPDQDSMSLSVNTFNPRAWEYNGVEVTVSVYMADAFNNPPITGTAVVFTTEGGNIDSGCTLDENGQCSVTWRSQNPRPTDGRVTILATAIGNESFVDTNGNGLFDTTDTFTTACGTANVPTCDDLPEAYLDANENNTHDSNEVFVDFNQNGSYDLADGAYNGVLCSTSNTDCADASRLLTVREDIVIVMASEVPVISFDNSTGNLDASGGSDSMVVTVVDRNGNSLPIDFTVDASSVGSSGQIDASCLQGDQSYPILNTTSSRAFSVTLTKTGTAPCTAGNTGLLEIKVSDPDGVVYGSVITNLTM